MFFSNQNKNTSATKQLELKLSGLHCTSCSLTIENELEETPGITTADVHYAQSIAKVQYDPNQTTPDRIKAVIEQLGYQVL